MTLHRTLVVRTLLCAVVLLAAAGAAEGKSYSADRFDSHIRLLPDGSLEVTETVVFRFESGTFSQVFRDIPKRRTDRIEFVRAAMDERTMPVGTAAGQVELRDRAKLRVRWHFPQPVSEATHTFTLVYRVAGAVRQTEDGDLLLWRALPTDHNYRIRESTVTIEHPVAPSGPPRVRPSRVGDTQIEATPVATTVSGRSIRNNGWLEVGLTFPAGSVVTTPPAWQLTQQRADALAPRWMTAAGLIIAAGLLLFWFMRQQYDAPRRSGTLPETLLSAPDDLHPALAASLAANGRVTLEHAMGVIFNFAERGDITIKEEPKGLFGQRSFVLERRRAGRPVAPHEQAVLDIVFTHKGHQESVVPLSKARSRLTSAFKGFRSAVRGEMLSHGLIDRDRQAMHARLGSLSLIILLLGSALFIGCAFLVREYRAWPLLVPSAVILVALAGFTMQGATTPLSNEGVRRGERWRAYRKHLKEVAAHEAHLTSESATHVLPFAVALGLATAWSKLLKATPGLVPPWFHAVAAAGDDASFPAFVAYGGSTGGGAGGGGGAAGGGGSGAS